MVAVVVAGLVGSIPATASGQTTPTPTPTTTGTHRVVVRPVDAAGQPSPGFTVHRQLGQKVTCEHSAQSAVDDGIYVCTPAAVYLLACWPSQHHTVLCLRDARNTKMLRLSYSGTLRQVKAPARPSPRALDLRGNTCEERVPGLDWGRQRSHPHWVGFYSCTHGDLWGPPSGDGINRSHEPWSVHFFGFERSHPDGTRAVRTAYFVGTA
jgi:hypothetical protein